MATASHHPAPISTSLPEAMQGVIWASEQAGQLYAAFAKALEPAAYVELLERRVGELDRQFSRITHGLEDEVRTRAARNGMRLEVLLAVASLAGVGRFIAGLSTLDPFWKGARVATFAGALGFYVAIRWRVYRALA